MEINEKCGRYEMMLQVDLLEKLFFLIDGVFVKKPQVIANHLSSHFVKVGLVNQDFKTGRKRRTGASFEFSTR